MAPLGNLIRLAPLQLDELPSHPVLEIRLHNSFVKADKKKGVQPKEDPPAPAPIEVSEAEAGAPSTSKDGLRVPGEDSITPHDGSNAQKDASYMSGYSKPSTVDDTGRPNLIPFIKTILDQGLAFIDDTIPSTFVESSLKSSSSASAKVQLLKRTISGDELLNIQWKQAKIPRPAPKHIEKTTEAWFARRSRHANRSLVGTADFPEFDYSLRVDHSEHERAYTPGVFDSNKVLEWEMEYEGGTLVIDSYTNITMCVYEMCHKLPFPLSPRVFPVLVVTAKQGPSSFIVVQIPVDLEPLPEAFYSNGRNLQEGDSALKKKKPVLGVYTSIERCVIREHQDIEWVMATASDAKGWLPMWMQKLGVPGAVVKDVGLVMKWLSKRRETSDHDTT